MKILHSSDFHLDKIDDFRWKAFEKVVEVAESESVDFFVIAGDLFDNDANADELRPSIRGVLSDKKFETLIIPGNHDKASFSSGLYFGEGVHIFNDADWSRNIFTVGDLHFIGIPFEDIDQIQFQGKLRLLKSRLDHKKKKVAIYHGELLDVSFDRDSFGVEQGRYMPSRLAFFSEINLDYVLSGHFHTSFNLRKYGENGYFLYPGSPVSITQKETGKRKVGFIDIGNEPKPIELNSFFYESINIEFNAFSTMNPISELKRTIKGYEDNCQILLKLNGTILGSEEDLVKEIKREVYNKNVELKEILFKDVSKIIGHPIYQLYESRINELQKNQDQKLSPADIDFLNSLVIQAMSRADL